MITSAPQTTAVVGFNTYLIGGNFSCTTFPAKGNITAINATMYFGGSAAMSGEWASDMLFVLIDPEGDGVQVGGFDVDLPNVTFGGYWADSWDTGATGTYHSLVPVKGITYGSGIYTACVANGYYYGEYPVVYSGSISLLGVVDNDPVPPGGSTATPVTETAAFIVPITLMVLLITGGLGYFAYYKFFSGGDGWGPKPWQSSGPDIKPTLTSSIIANESGLSSTPVAIGGGTPATTAAYVPPTVPLPTKAMTANPMRAAVSKDERL